MMLKKQFLLLAVGCMLICILVACGAGMSVTDTAGSATASGMDVHMNSTQFVQTMITIQKGQSVTLINDDALTPHIIANGTWENGAAKPGSSANAPKVNNVQINGGAQATIGPFTTAGTFKFYCTIHPGMNLTVTVQ